jgi:hypothetical protein
MNNVLIPDKASRSQAIETQVLENRHKHIPDISFERLLNISSILSPFTALYELPAQTATLLNSTSSLYDLSIYTSKAKEKNIAITPGTRESIDFPIRPPFMSYPNYFSPPSPLDIALARYLNPSLHFIRPEISSFSYHVNEYPSLDSTSPQFSVGMECQQDSPTKNCLIHYEGKEENKKKSPAYKGSCPGKAKRKKRKAVNLPKRPLSAYNIFFKDEREKILSEIPDRKMAREDHNERYGRKCRHGKISFECLAKEIGQRWQSLEPRRIEHYKALASKDMMRYKNDKEKCQERREETNTSSEKLNNTLQHVDEDSLIFPK